MASAHKKPKSNGAQKVLLGKNKKPMHPNQAKHLVRPGQILNPAGRPKGCRNKLGEAFLQDLLADWEVCGASALQACRLEDPSAYCRIVASILPKELSINENESEINTILDQFNTVDELQSFLAGIEALGAKERNNQKAITSSAGK